MSQFTRRNVMKGIVVGGTGLGLTGLGTSNAGERIPVTTNDQQPAETIQAARAFRGQHQPYSHILLVAGVVLSVVANVEGQGAAKTRKVTKRMSIIVFVCEHGAAKSVIAAAHFNTLASARNLNLRAISRGTNPDKELAPKAVEGLQTDGLAVPREKPTRLSESDVSTATQLVAFCELPEAYNKGRRVEQWNDVPAVSEDYGKARAIVKHVKQLLDELESAK